MNLPRFADPIVCVLVCGMGVCAAVVPAASQAWKSASAIRRRLGERPTDPAKRKAWERGVEGIERYRQEHGITDRQRALGSQADGLDRIAQRQAERTLRESQRSLGRQMEAARVRDLGRSHGIEM